jgi:sigma-E factor negative regulatory protein RseC
LNFKLRGIRYGRLLIETHLRNVHQGFMGAASGAIFRRTHGPLGRFFEMGSDARYQMATEQGIVLRTDSGTAWVKTVRSSACDGCSARGSCHTATGTQEMEVKALNTAGARAGDRIVLSFETPSLLKATFLIYVFPIIWLIVGAVLGQMLAPIFGLNPAAMSILSGFAFFFGALALVRIGANQMAQKNAYQPKVTKILPKRPEEGDEESKPLDI